ncbi:hypothetical protein TTHERM_001194950, partial (macronuclear) [Tetrahymena thermophila SB210]
LLKLIQMMKISKNYYVKQKRIKISKNKLKIVISNKAMSTQIKKLFRRAPPKIKLLKIRMIIQVQVLVIARGQHIQLKKVNSLQEFQKNLLHLQHLRSKRKSKQKLILSVLKAHLKHQKKYKIYLQLMQIMIKAKKAKIKKTIAQIKYHNNNMTIIMNIF